MKSIRVQRKESILKEIVAEAISLLNDDRINSLVVLDVICSRGASDCKVYLEKGLLTKKEQNEAIKLLNKAKGFISRHIVEMTSWYKSPNFSFSFDELYEKELKMESLFEKIKKGN